MTLRKLSAPGLMLLCCSATACTVPLEEEAIVDGDAEQSENLGEAQAALGDPWCPWASYNKRMTPSSWPTGTIGWSSSSTGTGYGSTWCPGQYLVEIVNPHPNWGGQYDYVEFGAQMLYADKNTYSECLNSRVEYGGYAYVREHTGAQSYFVWRLMGVAKTHGVWSGGSCQMQFDSGYGPVVYDEDTYDPYYSFVDYVELVKTRTAAKAYWATSPFVQLKNVWAGTYPGE
jgi:hypothetical protein